MGGLLKKPKAPEVPDPTPLPDEAALERERRRAAQQARQESGRASTQLADRPAQTGSEFTRTTLG